MLREAWLKKMLVLQNLGMFVWTSGFQNLLAHTHFDMFVDEWTSANESPGSALAFIVTVDPSFACHGPQMHL